MNDNNSWQRMGALLPRHNLGPIAQRQALLSSPEQSRALVPVGQLIEGGGSPSMGMPASAMRQPRPQQYDQGQPTGKKILGMPKDRFIALMGTIAHAFGGDSASGRMGTGLVSMADMMRGERMAQGERQATEAEARRKFAAELAKERRKTEAKIATEKRGVTTTIAKEKRGAATTIAKEGRGTAATIAKEKRKTAAMVAKEKRAAEREIPSAWEATYKSMWGKIDPDTKRPYTIEKIRTIHGKTEIKPATRSEKLAHRKLVDTYYATAFGITKEGIPHAEYEESQYTVDGFNEMSDKPFVLRRVPGIPKEEKSFMGMDILRPDVPAIPATMEKVPISQFKTPDDVMSADWLSDKAKRRLIEKLFSNQFRK